MATRAFRHAAVPGPNPAPGFRGDGEGMGKGGCRHGNARTAETQPPPLVPGHPLLSARSGQGGRWGPGEGCWPQRLHPHRVRRWEEDGTRGSAGFLSWVRRDKLERQKLLEWLGKTLTVTWPPLGSSRTPSLGSCVLSPAAETPQCPRTCLR